MAATIEEQFRAAVRLIQSMPANGTFQPSNELMLKFYGFFKQATLGPCSSPKPGFWEVIKKAKWDAWKKLGDMPAEEAMTNYVEELKKIAETMPYTDDMANFIHVLGPFYEAIYPEGHAKLSALLRREVEEKDESGQDNESGYSSGSQELAQLPEVEVEETEMDNEKDELVSRSIYGSTTSVTGSEKFYSDTESDGEYADPEQLVVLETAHHIIEHNYSSAPTFTTSTNASPKVEPASHLAAAVQRLQKDVSDMQRRVMVMENRAKVEFKLKTQPSAWWPFPELSPRTALVIALWPFVAHLVISSLRRKIKQ